MPTPFMCHWCDKPTMNESGICIECEQKYEEGNKDIAGTVRELETRIKWLEKGLKLIADGRDDMNPIYIKQQAQSILDGEPTTADEYNDEQDVQLGASIVKSNDEVSGVFMVDGKIKQIDYESSPENTVRISDINKEIAKEWKKE
tara:strand:+ start:4658 stop:5092 length:435 start_codon:yes stop_codon:yes gene_type:complete